MGTCGKCIKLHARSISSHSGPHSQSVDCGSSRLHANNYFKIVNSLARGISSLEERMSSVTCEGVPGSVQSSCSKWRHAV